MSDFELDITGELPLEFDGECLIEESNHWTNGKDNNRYHCLEIYKTKDDDGDYWIVYIQYKSHWQGENDYYEAHQLEQKEDIKQVLDDYDPIKYLVGFPKADRFEEKQNNLIKKLKFDWQEMKVEALKELGFKRPVGRPRKGDKPRVNVNVCLDPALRKQAEEMSVNLSQFLNDALAEHFSKK